jgi:hypothetical protein
MNGKLPHLAGKRYVNLIRCSTFQQSDTSIPDQQKLLDAFGNQHGMTHVDDVILDGVSGSTPGSRTDIDMITTRKKERNDFDTLLVQDMSRFTRSGAEHGMKLLYDLNAAGIEVVFAADNLPEGDHSGIIKAVGFIAAQQYAKSLSFAAARGAMSSLEQGRTAHCLRAPYGIDRLYISTDGRPLHIIRDMPDGSQQKLHPETGALLDTFAADVTHGRSSHYRMQANERVTLIPGDPSRVEVVRHMFRRRLIDGWAGFRIAREFDGLSIRSGNGKPWSVSTINRVLSNPVYTGIGIANRLTQAIYHSRAKNAPKPAVTDRKQLANRRRPKMVVRPREDWMEIMYPLLAEFLGDLRAKAVAWQAGELSKQALGVAANPGSKDRHADSPYILKGLLRSAQGNHPLTGRTLGKRDAKYRYYAVHRGFTVPKVERTLRRLIPAKPLEQVVLEAVRETLGHAPELRERILALVEKQQQDRAGDAGDLKKLERERDRIRTQIEVAIDILGEAGREAAESKLRQLRTKLEQINGRIQKALEASPTIKGDAAAIADQIVLSLSKLGQRLDGMPSNLLRQLLAALISKLVVDLDTKNVEIELALPDWATLTKLNADGDVCLESTFARRCSYQANQENAAKIAVYYCHGIDRRHLRLPGCFDCKRRKAA